jgi:AsmA protein
MKRALKIAAIAIAVVLVILIALPFVVVDVNAFRPRLELELSTALGREVKVGNLGLSILAGTVTADNLSIADDPAFSKDPFVRAKQLKVGVELMPLIFSKTLHVTEIKLDQPEIFLVRSPAGKWNFSSIGGNSNAKPAAAPSAPAAAPSSTSSDSSSANLSVSKLEVADGRITIAHANSSAKPQVYDKVNIEVTDFSFTSQFPFTLSAQLPGGGSLKLEGKAGPINPNDAAETPLEAQISVKQMDLAASGFVDPSVGIAGLADFDGTLSSDGRQAHTSGTVHADKLKLSPKGKPAGRAVDVKYATDYDLSKQAGTLTQGDISLGKALARLTGTYRTQGETTLLNMKLSAPGMPVDELEAILPALGVFLPSGSSLQGGTLSTELSILGPLDKLVIAGPIKLANSKLAGFDLGSKLSAVSKLNGARTGMDTSIQNLSTDARVTPDGTRTDNLNLTIPAVGVLTGAGTISPAGALNYKMTANVSGTAVSQLSQLAGLGGGGASIPFFIQGTTSDPKFVPDVQGIVGSQLKGLAAGAAGKNPAGNSPLGNALSGLFGKRKK